MKERQLYIYNDNFSQNAFIFKTVSKVFARVNKIGNLWCVWFYKKHLQKNFTNLKEAISDVNETFIKEYRGL